MALGNICTEKSMLSPPPPLLRLVSQRGNFLYRVFFFSFFVTCSRDSRQSEPRRINTAECLVSRQRELACPKGPINLLQQNTRHRTTIQEIHCCFGSAIFFFCSLVQKCTDVLHRASHFVCVVCSDRPLTDVIEIWHENYDMPNTNRDYHLPFLWQYQPESRIQTTAL